MAGFLCNHDRYHTMNSWNVSKSVSNCIKVDHLNLPDDVQPVMWDALQDEFMYEDIRYALDDFENEYNHNFMIGTNGRSGGYLVLYKGTSTDTGYKSRCGACCSYSKDKVPPEREPFGICGRCGEPRVKNLQKPVLRHHATGQGYGDDYQWNEEDMMDRDEWDISTLGDEVKFFQDFDKACSNYVEAFVGWCRNELIDTKESA